MFNKYSRRKRTDKSRIKKFVVISIIIMLSISLFSCTDISFNSKKDSNKSKSEENIGQDKQENKAEHSKSNKNPNVDKDKKNYEQNQKGKGVQEKEELADFDYSKVPAYKRSPFVVINDNIPHFDKKYFNKKFETYSKLDTLGRCGTAFSNIGPEIMPTKKRGSIGMIKPTGWHTVKYNNIPGRYLYNRCHLIGHQLAGEDANKLNLITGTKYLNNEGMLPFENMIADYVKETGKHVLYRVTPIFVGDELVARGVHMEAESSEDDGKAIMLNVFIYNVQPGIEIDYYTGQSFKSN